jgi:3-oxoadipate enol-lactonase
MTRASNPFNKLRCIVIMIAIASVAAGSASARERAAQKRAAGGAVAVDGGTLYYEMAGKGEPIVFIHGGQMDRRMWDDQFDLFARHFKVIRYDVRGYGKSSLPARGYSCTDDLYSLLKALHVNKAHFVGLSLGGRIAIDFALTHPEMVAGLVLVGPGLSGFQFSNDGGARYWAVVEAARDKSYAEAAELWLKDPYMAPAMANSALQSKLRKLASENGPAWLMNPLLERDLKPPAVGRLAEIHAPTLIIVGDRDVPDIQKIVEKLSTDISGAKKVVIRGAGHIVNMEKPDEFNRALFDFLGRSPSN